VFHVSIWGLGALSEGDKCIKSPPPRGDGNEQTGQKLNKLQVTIFSYKLLWISAAHVITVVKWRHQNYAATNLHCS